MPIFKIKPGKAGLISSKLDYNSQISTLNNLVIRVALQFLQVANKSQLQDLEL